MKDAGMKYPTALAICKNINTEKATDLEKGRAIQMMIDSPTYNSTTKANMVEIIRWLWDKVFEEVE